MPFFIPTLHIASPTSKRCHIYGLGALQFNRRNAIGAARALSCLAKSNDNANSNKKDLVGLSPNDEEIIAGAESGRRSWYATLEPHVKRSQQQVSSPSQDTQIGGGWWDTW